MGENLRVMQVEVLFFFLNKFMLKELRLIEMCH